MDMKSIVDRVEKVDAMTVRFVLKKSEAPFMANLAMDFASVLSTTPTPRPCCRPCPNTAPASAACARWPAWCPAHSTAPPAACHRVHELR